MKKLATLLTSLILAFGLVGLVYAQQMGGRVGNQMEQTFFYQSASDGISLVSGLNTLTVPSLVATTATITGISSGNLLPSTGNTYNLGSGSYKWKDVFVNGTYYGGTALMADGSVSSPSYAFAGDTNTGIYRAGGDNFVLVTNSTPRYQVTNGGNYFYTSVQPNSNNIVDLGANGNAWKNIYASGTVRGDKFYAGDGAVGTPSITFGGDTDTGFYSYATNHIGATTLGAIRFDIGTSAITTAVDINPWTDNTYDLGSSVKTYAESHVQDAYVYDTLTTGQFKFEEDAGFPTWADMSVSATPAVGTQMSYTAKIDGEYFLKLYSEADSSGGIQNKSINMYPDTLKLGKRDVTSYIYVGTADGCGVWEFSSSSTSPTLTPTSTSFCN